MQARMKSITGDSWPPFSGATEARESRTDWSYIVAAIAVTGYNNQTSLISLSHCLNLLNNQTMIKSDSRKQLSVICV